jgi:hypothetical protein
MKGSLDGMTNLRDAAPAGSIRYGNNEVLPASKVGTWKGHITMSNGCKHPVTLNHMKYVPNIAFNLFSLTSAAANGGNISNRGKVFILQKESLTITFNTMITTRHGYLCAANMTPGQMEIGNAGLQVGTKIAASTLHGMLGHCCEAHMRKTAQDMDIVITGRLQKCEDCAIAKIHQKPVPKVTHQAPTTHTGELMYIDISSTFTTSYGGKKYWVLMVDDFSDCCVTKFVAK